MNAEFAILNFIQENLRSDILDKLMVGITTLGNGGFIWILFCVLALVTKKYRKMGIALAIGLVLSLVLGNIILKPVFARPRPSWLNGAVTLLIANPTDFSFPSGHTLAAAISAFIITYYKKKAGFFVIPLAALIAFSRLYLYVHFPTDILGGIVIGILIGFASVKIGKIMI